MSVAEKNVERRIEMKITLKAARVNRNLSQKQAGELIGVTEDVIGNWERGKTVPDVLMIPKIESAYGVSYNDINFLPNSTV